MPSKSRKEYSGPVLFSYGFRPFFLLASVFALVVIPLWVAVFVGAVELKGPFAPTYWHIHEMLFGYAAAVIAGFLFTAIPNWTGRMPVRGWPLGVLVLLWVVGRFAMAGALGLPPLGVMVVDASFLAAIVAMVAVEIIAGKNWRNIKVLIPVVLLLLSNIAFHVEVLKTGSAGFSTRAGFGAVIFLVILIGGRIIPSFTRNWLAKKTSGPLPAPFGKYDGLSIVIAVLALGIWVVVPDSMVAGGVLIVAAIMHFIRVARWQGARIISTPLLLMLHVAYGFVPAGLLLLGLDSTTEFDTYTAGLHLLGIGAIGGITVAVMMRATLGHTGRELVASRDLTLAFGLIVGSGILRSFASDIDVFGLTGIEIAAGFWTLGFALFVARVGVWLIRPRAQKRTANRR